MNNETFGMNRQRNATFMSQAEQVVFNALEQSPEEISFEIEGPPVEMMGKERAGFRYVPDFVLKNRITGRSLVIEVKSAGSMSLANLVKLRTIQETLKGDGISFVMLVFGMEQEVLETHFNTHGVNALGFISGNGLIEKLCKLLEL